MYCLYFKNKYYPIYQSINQFIQIPTKILINHISGELNFSKEF